MSIVYVVKNQLGLFASKQKEWVDGREPKILFRSPHKDEAINMVFELSSKDIYVRAEAIEAELNDIKQPIVEVTAEAPKPIGQEDLDIPVEDELNARSTESSELPINMAGEEAPDQEAIQDQTELLTN